MYSFLIKQQFFIYMSIYKKNKEVKTFLSASQSVPLCNVHTVINSSQIESELAKIWNHKTFSFMTILLLLLQKKLEKYQQLTLCVWRKMYTYLRWLNSTLSVLDFSIHSLAFGQLLWKVSMSLCCSLIKCRANANFLALFVLVNQCCLVISLMK